METEKRNALLANLDLIVQLWAAWSAQWEQHILQHGVPLNTEQRADALCAGVALPDRVRLLEVPSIPVPLFPMVYAALKELEMIGSGTFGLCLRYGIFITSIHWNNRRRVIHELAHTAQYERLGGFPPCLEQYLREALSAGYHESPLELEAEAAVERCLGA